MRQRQSGPESLTDRAQGDLQLIRSMMQRTQRFVPLPGWGVMTVGVIGCSAAWLSRNLNDGSWMFFWLGAATVSLLVVLAVSLWQSRNTGRSVLLGRHRSFWLALLPSFLAAALLTLALGRVQAAGLLPGLWLLLYGSAMVGAGRHAVPQVGWMGWSFMLLGALALLLPGRSLFMGLGFGGLHLLFGLMIALDGGKRAA